MNCWLVNERRPCLLLIIFQHRSMFVFQFGTILLRYLPCHGLFHSHQPFLGYPRICLLRGKSSIMKRILWIYLSSPWWNMEYLWERKKSVWISIVNLYWMWKRGIRWCFLFSCTCRTRSNPSLIKDDIAVFGFVLERFKAFVACQLGSKEVEHKVDSKWFFANQDF